jgi:glycosyltransferase involved in cell wall biosynthesis
MDISVILPAYNSQEYLEEAVDSVLRQDFKGSFELIIVDDCSSDRTPEILRRYDGDARVSVHRTEVNGGYPTAMNLGLSKARGRYVARMDADDVWHPSLLTVEFNAHERHPEVAFVSSLRFWLTLTGKPYHKPSNDDTDYRLETWQNLIDRKRSFTDVGTLFLREQTERIGGYNTYQRSGMDVDHWLRTMELTGKPCMTLNLPLVGKRLVPGSIIFKSQTTRANEIVRKLAMHRKEKGLPPDHRPDAAWLEAVKSEHNAVKSDGRKVGMIMDVAFINLRMGDTYGFFRFLRQAMGRNLLGTLRFIAARLLRGNRSDYRPGLPSVDTNKAI